MMLLRLTFLTVLVGALSNSGPVAVAASAGPPPNAAGAVHRVNAELHIFSKGSHGFGMGERRGESTALWPTSFVAWLHDCGIIEDQP